MGSEIIPHRQQSLAADGEPWDAGKVVAAIAVTARQTGLKIPPAWRAIVGRNAKALLADGFRGDLVVAACYMAILRGRPEIAQYVAGDLALRESGHYMSRAEYEEKLALYTAGKSTAARMLAEQRDRLAERERDIERRRNGG